MSSTLYWKPVTSGALPLPDELKRALSNHMMGSTKARFSDADVPFLKGMAAIASDPLARHCNRMIEAIEKHGAIELWHEY